MEEEEWWEAFFDLSIRLYPFGVQQNNIWIEADGDGSRVKSGRGREQWNDALSLLRNGGAGGTMTVEGLLHQCARIFLTIKNFNYWRMSISVRSKGDGNHGWFSTDKGIDRDGAARGADLNDPAFEICSIG
jgi:hypothetical protein